MLASPLAAEKIPATMSLVNLLIAFVGGTIALGFMLIHAIGPALVLLAITPFDAIFFSLFGWIGNAVTYPPIMVLLLRNSPSAWSRIFFGSQVQAAAAVLIVALSISHLVSINYYGFDMIVEYAKKVTLFLLLGVFAYAIRRTEHLELAIKVLVVSMALFTFLNMLDFYLGIQILPETPSRFDDEALINKEFEAYRVGEFRLRAAGLPINRFSNWLLMPTIVAIGWFFRAQKLSARAIAGICIGTLILGQAAILSRGGAIALAAGLFVLMPTAFRFRIQTVIAVAVIGGAVALVGFQLFSMLGVDEALGSRFTASQVTAASFGRLSRVMAGFQIFGSSPLIGVGDSHFQARSAELLGLEGGGRGSHNAYIQILAEAGVVGFIPFIVLLFFVVRRLALRDARVPAEYDYWRPYFLAAFASLLVHNVVHDYQWERLFWITISYAAALEHVSAAQSAERRREEMHEDPYGFGTPASDTGGWHS